MTYLVGLAATLLLALFSLRGDPPGRQRNLRVVASIVVVAMLWLLAPRPAAERHIGTGDDAPIRTDSIHWTHRVSVGDPVEVRGRVTGGQRLRVQLIGPDGRVDSSSAEGEFSLRSRSSAVGHWTWTLVLGKDSVDVGVDVRPLPSLRLLILEGRPSFETAALARRLISQGASVTTATRLTGNDVRVIQGGPRAPSRVLSRENLAGLDAVIFAPGGSAMLSAAERGLLLAEVSRGLGLMHLVDTVQSKSELFPFSTATAGLAAMKIRVTLNHVAATTPLTVAPVTLRGGNDLLSGAGGESLGRLTSHGSGSIGAVRMPATSGWTLAGEDSLAGLFWSEALSPLLRPARAEWRVSDSAHARVDERLIVERIGDTTSMAEFQEAGSSRNAIGLAAAPGDSLRRRGALWPNTPGWLWLSTGGDTLWLLVAPPRFNSTHPGAPLERFPALHWLAWGVLLAGITTLWRRR